jgi:hypothetical protein
MGSFQITYDDFSGGQYMGNKSTNLPKNQWDGTNVIATPNGGIIPTMSEVAGSWAVTGSPTFGSIYDHWVLSSDSYAFVTTTSDYITFTSRLVKTNGINDGQLFPSTGVPYSLTGVLNGNVAFYPATSLFYYISTAGNIYSVTTGGTVSAAISTNLAGLGLTNITSYGYRLLAWGGTNATSKKRLYYSDTTLATWTTGAYYEFSGTILNVLPRTNDLLVICDTGVFSLVGVLGSSVTNQLIVPQENITEGMRDAVVVGRSAYFIDQLANGSLDGRIYRLTGSSVQSVEVMKIADTIATTGLEQGRVMAVNDGRIVIMLRSGTCYAETSKGQWCRFESNTFGPPSIINSNIEKQIQVGRAGLRSLNEYFAVALFNNITKSIEVRRYVHNTIIPVPSGVFLSPGLPAGLDTAYPFGQVSLPEYWHSKPFTVKEMFVEYQPVYGDIVPPVVNASIQPTGNVDALIQNISSMQSSSITNMTQSTGTAETYVFERFRPNNASKGFGVIPKLDFQAATIKRVILNCED